VKKIYAESGPKRISGAKGGGGGGSGGGESPDSLHSVARAKVLDAISEGPIVGLVKGMQSVFLDGTPIQNSAARSTSRITASTSARVRSIRSSCRAFLRSSAKQP
jgi:hypothetical protein